MTNAFRVCFHFTGKATLTSDKEFVEFKTLADGMPLKLSSGIKGVPIGKTERFSVSGADFDSPESAHNAAELVRHALLLFSARTRSGLDLGQNSLRSFAISAYGKQLVAQQLGAELVMEDHLGITVFPAQPKPSFVRMNMTGTVSRPVEALVSDLAATVGQCRFRSPKAEVAAGLYALSHFAGRAPARFLLLFIALEALFEPTPRSPQVQEHISTLLATTKASELTDHDKQALLSALSFQRTDSIAATGRRLAESAVGEQVYDSLLPGPFFSRIYKVRNDMVHRGRIDPESMHVLVGEVDRFVADIVSSQVNG